MLGLAAAILSFFLLPKATAELFTADAKCLSGFQWMFSSINQSSCDVAAELASVCIDSFNLMPLASGYVYLGPYNTNNCECSSVYYSLVSACAHCQGRTFLPWPAYSTNCQVVYITVYNQQIPVGVKVPAYAYQNVSASNIFNVTLAQSTTGVESSRPPSSTTSTRLTSNSPGSTTLPTSTPGPSKPNIGAIVGGIVGGLVFLLIGAFITFFVLRSKRRQRSQGYNPGFQQTPNMNFTPNITASLIPTMTPPPGSISDSHEAHIDSLSIHNPYRLHSPPITPHETGNSAQLEFSSSATNYQLSAGPDRL